MPSREQLPKKERAFVSPQIGRGLPAVGDALVLIPPTRDGDLNPIKVQKKRKTPATNGWPPAESQHTRSAPCKDSGTWDRCKAPPETLAICCPSNCCPATVYRAAIHRPRPRPAVLSHHRSSCSPPPPCTPPPSCPAACCIIAVELRWVSRPQSSQV